MLVANRYLDHRDDAELGERVADAHRVVLSDTDRQRSRVRTETADGRDLGIVVSRDLGDGDVLETEGGELVVVELAAIDVLIIDFDDADVSTTAALEFGHAAGNRHWELAVRGDAALFPVPDTRERMLDAVREELPDGVTTRFERVSPTTFDDGPAPSGGHGHTHDHGSNHAHEDTDAHSHGDTDAHGHGGGDE